MSTTHPARVEVAPEITIRDDDLTARMEPFDSFWEAPANIERGYSTFARFYAYNYLPHFPANKQARVLVISCGPGYLVNLLTQRGYTNVTGIDSDAAKISHARRRNLPCRVASVFAFLAANREPLDVIFAEQEINHLTKTEILAFLAACRQSLAPGGTLIVHSINGANPLTGSESRSGNFDHYNSFTEYSLKQVLEYAGFTGVRVIPLNLYVFFHNPLNYVAWGIAKLNDLFFRVNFKLVGKEARIFTKKIAAICTQPMAHEAARVRASDSTASAAPEPQGG